MTTITIPSDLRQTLEAKVLAMAETMVRGDGLGEAQFYADNALLTDLKEFHVEGREAIDQYWTGLPTFSQWQLTVLETGGDADTPHQRLHSLAHIQMEDQEYIDEGYSFVVWKKQPDGDYRIHVNVYSAIRFEAQ